jgi:cysteinyl-tRNA synthetase
MAEIRLFNTLSRKKEIFTPLDPDGKRVGLYACGPTVYNYAHIGNLRTYIFEDILKRVLEYNGYEVQHVMNITDVGHLTSDADEGEDKLEKGARQEGKTVWEIADYYTKVFQKNLADLNVSSPKVWCKATDYIKQQIAFIQSLEANGLTYETSDGIYFDTSQYSDYATLGKLNLEGQKAGARVEENIQKRNSTDFALWKFSPKDHKRQMEWNSPWGIGFPGWHIECSAMSMEFLGDKFDIHCGGIDHIPVHHTNERAQNWGKTNKESVNYWLHGEFLVIDEKRMGKSEGNFVTLQTLIDKGFDPLAYRYLCLQAHYRQKLNFSWEALESAQNGLNNLQEKVLEICGDFAGKKVSEIDSAASKYIDEFEQSINDDLNTSSALATLYDFLKADFKDEVAWSFISRADQVLGLGLGLVSKSEIPSEVEVLAQQRLKARSKNDWKLADELRSQIEQQGFIIKDTESGYSIKKK